MRIGDLASSRLMKMQTPVVLAVLAAFTLAACGAAGGGAGASGGGGFFARNAGTGTGGGTAGNENLDYDPDFFLKRAYCPPVQSRLGTAVHRIYERGKDGDENALRYQASLGDMARECSAVSGSLSVKLGIKGRVVSGPKGGPGTVNLPLRVAVVKQSNNAVLYSQLYTLPVPLQGLTTNFSQVIPPIPVTVTPEDRDLIVYVGYDGGSG